MLGFLTCQGTLWNQVKTMGTSRKQKQLEMVVFLHFSQSYKRYLTCFELLTCQGALWNQSETRKTLKEPWGTFENAKKVPNGINKKEEEKKELSKETAVLIGDFLGFGRDSSCFLLFLLPLKKWIKTVLSFQNYFFFAIWPFCHSCGCGCSCGSLWVWCYYPHTLRDEMVSHMRDFRSTD